MFFHRRSTQAEYFDLPNRPESETIAAFRDLDRLNLAFRFDLPFHVTLPRWLGPARCERLELLDLGAGTGLLGKRLSEWASRQGWCWRFTNLDTNPLALTLGNAPRSIAGSALALPFTDGSFDVVLASQMTHHLTDEEAVLHLREAWRVTRDGLFICDLNRNAGLYLMLWLSTRLMRVCRPVCEDALISVKRGFSLNELRVLAGKAQLATAKVWLFYASRIVLQARKAA
jgi:2-polyprenyl-3-methyl-5-hydroxy-6-metoxy-1,4-benzoquinol methylase